MILPLLATLPAAASLQSTSIGTFTQPAFRDIQFNATIERKNLGELRKINPEFANTYLFDSIVVRAKEPFKLRLDAAADDTKATYVINGTLQQFRVPRLGLRKNDDLAKYPGRRQTLLDFAVPTASLFEGFYAASFVRNDRETGNPVFDLRFPRATEDTSRQRVWIDRAHHTIARREWYSQTDRLRAVFLYEAPVESNGVWFPTRLTVRNAENKVAGVTRYSNVRANQGLADALFKL